MRACPFCSSRRFVLLKGILGTDDLEHFSVCRTSNFVVVPDIAPLVEGHVLIIPHRHYLCCGMVLQDRQAEFVELKALVAHTLQIVYGKSMFIEHGAARDMQAGNSIDHAHLHCIPANVDITDGPDNLRRKWEPLGSFLDLRAFSAQNQAYLFYESPTGTTSIHIVDKSKIPMPSQYLRKCFADRLGTSWWDWREMTSDPAYQEINSKRILDGLRKIKAALSYSGKVRL